jgi:hypothetical protein
MGKGTTTLTSIALVFRISVLGLGRSGPLRLTHLYPHFPFSTTDRAKLAVSLVALVYASVSLKEARKLNSR